MIISHSKNGCYQIFSFICSSCFLSYLLIQKIENKFQSHLPNIGNLINESSFLKTGFVTTCIMYETSFDDNDNNNNNKAKHSNSCEGQVVGKVLIFVMCIKLYGSNSSKSSIILCIIINQ